MAENEQTAADAGDHKEDKAAVDEMLEGQTPAVYPTTKVTRRKPMGIKLVPIPKGLRADLSPSQVGALYWVADIVQHIYEHATDGSQHIAEEVGDRIDGLLVRYPIEWTDPKPKKPETK